MTQLADIQTEINRLRLADKRIGWNVERGMFRLVSTEYDRKGKAVVTDLIGPLDGDAFLDAVRELA